MNQEIASMQQESKDFSASAGVNFGGTGWNANMNASFAYHTSKEQSNNTAFSDAKEVTEKALDRVVNKVREERIQKVMEEFEENNKHGFDNRQGAEHISGVFRWVDKIMKNEIHNYGKRLTFEFMIPEPAKLQRYMTESIKLNTSEITKPETLWPGSIAPNSYLGLAERYGAEVSPPPPFTRVISRNIAFTGPPIKSGDGHDGNEKYSGNETVVIPKGYYTSKLLSACFSGKHDEDSADKKMAGLTVGDRHFQLDGTLDKGIYYFDLSEEEGIIKPVGRAPLSSVIAPNSSIGWFEEELPVSIYAVNYWLGSFSISVEVTRTEEAYQAWLAETTFAIQQAYEARMQEYRDKKAQAEMQQKRERTVNPMFYRDIENNILKKNCLDYLLEYSYPLGAFSFQTGSSIQDQMVHRNPDLDSYGALVKFMEQAFEWNIMGYQFYPYYWGDKASWGELNTFECDDKLFTKFMQSGMARVILTVRPGFEDAVNWFMATGEVWNGANAPLIDDPLYLDLADEMEEAPYVLEDTWETRIPTTLTVIQEGIVGLQASGLPCDPDCKEYSESGFYKKDDSVLANLNTEKKEG